MKLISGLGNPTRKYRMTRHNVGFMVIDRLAEDLSVRLRKSIRLSSFMGEGSAEGEKVVLQKPLTFMNLSGRAVGAAARKKGLDAGDILVVCDDVNLELGRMRMRRSGSSGGHNGLKSIIEGLATDRFQRLRIGIGKDTSGERDLSGYVLDKFDKRELTLLEGILEAASEAVMVYLTEGIESAMTKYNN